MATPPTDTIYCRVPAPVKLEAEKMAAKHHTTLARVVGRALEVYLKANGAKLPGVGELP